MFRNVIFWCFSLHIWHFVETQATGCQAHVYLKACNNFPLNHIKTITKIANQIRTTFETSNTHKTNLAWWYSGWAENPRGDTVPIILTSVVMSPEHRVMEVILQSLGMLPSQIRLRIRFNTCSNTFWFYLKNANVFLLWWRELKGTPNWITGIRWWLLHLLRPARTVAIMNI